MTPQSRQPQADLIRWAEAQLAPGLSWTRLAGDGSDKIFWRVRHPGGAAVVADGSGLSPDRRTENRSLALIGRHLAAQGLPVPRLLATAEEKGFFLMEDLGDDLLSDRAGRAGSEQRLALYRQAAETLLDLQIQGLVGFDPRWCSQTQRYDREMILKYESQYFLRAFARDYCRARVDSPQLTAELAALAERAAGAGPTVFLHRDYQSRNLLLHQGRVRVVDFQGGRLGPAGYDLASLLIDPYVGLTDQEQAAIFEYYLGRAGERRAIEATGFRRDYPVLALQRNLQVLGAFGFLTLVKGRPGFASYIPPALAGLKARLAGPEFQPYPALRELSAGLNAPEARP